MPFGKPGTLKPGQDFNDLTPSVIIFICAFDPFGKGFYRYTFEERCQEEDFPLNDGTKKIFLSTVGTNQKGVPEAVLSFLKYVMNSTDDCVARMADDNLKKIHRRIKVLKQSRELEERYMQFEELLKKEREEGHDEGSRQMLELVSCMMTAGKADQIQRLKTDEDFYQEMLKEYNL